MMQVVQQHSGGYGSGIGQEDDQCYDYSPCCLCRTCAIAFQISGGEDHAGIGQTRGSVRIKARVAYMQHIFRNT